jgi:hypothetical protein
MPGIELGLNWQEPRAQQANHVGVAKGIALPTVSNQKWKGVRTVWGQERGSLASGKNYPAQCVC